QPDGPTMVTNSPSRTSSVTSARTRIEDPARVRYVFSRREIAMSEPVIPDIVLRMHDTCKGAERYRLVSQPEHRPIAPSGATEMPLPQARPVPAVRVGRGAPHSDRVTTRGQRSLIMPSIGAVLVAAALVASAPTGAALAQSTLRIGMTASDIPYTGGQTDQG